MFVLDNLLTVSQLNRYVKSVLDGDFRLKDLLLKGEISNFTDHYRSGHFYFTLKEGDCAVKAVMFSKYAKGLVFHPENGMSVIVRCSVSLYERDGSYQIYVYDMQPDGKGSLQLAFEQRYRKLEAMGFFDEERKQSLPAFPQKIGVVTSPTGAALQDIINVLSRRYPIAQLMLAPALVQGEQAPDSLRHALVQLEHANCDVILLARGGCSAEDLWCFNDEKLVMQIALCSTPVVSAVGHEIDFTLCDYAADLRAPTPSAAAELVSPDMEKLRENIECYEQRMITALQKHIERYQTRLDHLKNRSCFQHPKKQLERKQQKLDCLSNTIQNSVKNKMIQEKTALLLQQTRLQALNPIERLNGGFTFTTKDQTPVSSVCRLAEGDLLHIRFKDGSVSAKVTDINPLKE